MSDLTHRIITANSVDRVMEALSVTPLHVQGMDLDPSNGQRIFGLSAGMGWIRQRRMAVIPFVADPIPDELVVGTFFPAHPQARIYFLPVAGASPNAQITFDVWHRDRRDGSATSTWVRGTTLTLQASTEGLDVALYHREIYIQVTAYNGAGGAATHMDIMVAGGQDMQVDDFSATIVPGASIDVARAYATPPAALVIDGSTLELTTNRQGYLRSIDSLASNAYQHFLGITVGAYVPPAALGTAITFTGVNLTGRVSYIWNVTDQLVHRVTNVVDPVLPAVGTLTISPAVVSANAVFIIPITSIPPGYDLLADANRTNQLNPPQGHSMFDPSLTVTLAAAVPDTAPFPAFPIGNNNRITVQVEWTCIGAATWQIDFFLRAYPAATLCNINSLFTVCGTALGVPTGGTVGLIATINQPIKGYEFVVQRTGAGAAGNHTMVGTVNQHYA